MILSICLKGLILYNLFWECESKIIEIQGVKLHRRIGDGMLDIENDIEDTNVSYPKDTKKGSSEDSKLIRLTNISINQPTEEISMDNTKNTSPVIDTVTKTDKNNNSINLNELIQTTATIPDLKPLQETPVLKTIQETQVPVTIIDENIIETASIATIINNITKKEDITELANNEHTINNTSMKQYTIATSNNEHDSKNPTTISSAIRSEISTDRITVTDDSQLDIIIKMNVSNDSLSIIDITTSNKPPNDKVNTNSILAVLKDFANRFMKILKGLFAFKRFNDVEDEPLQDNYNIYVPISEDVSRMQYNSAEKQHVHVLREGALSLLGNDRNDK